MTLLFAMQYTHRLKTDPFLPQPQLDKSARVLILASDGVFEFMTNEEVLHIARAKRKDGPLVAASTIVATTSDTTVCHAVHP